MSGMGDAMAAADLIDQALERPHLGSCVHIPDAPDGIFLRDAPPWEEEAMEWRPDRGAEELAAWDAILGG